MRQMRLALLLNLLWLGFAGLGAFVLLTVPPKLPILAALGATALMLALVTSLFALRGERRARARLSALGAAVGSASIARASIETYVGEMVAGLCLRLERARLYQTAFEISSHPALIVDAEGRILKMSAGLATRAPECAEADTAQMLFGVDVLCAAEPAETYVQFAGLGWQASSYPLGADRWLIGLSRPGVVVPDAGWQAMADALVGGDTGFRFSPNQIAITPELEAVNAGFEALDRSVRAMAALAQEGEAAQLVNANDGLSPQIMAVAQTVQEIARARDEALEANQQARARLDKVGALVDQCRSSAKMLLDGAESARLSSDAARDALAEGRQASQELAQARTALAAKANAAGDAARRTRESAESFEALTREIDKLVAGVEDTSFRTNLLALNAAVEAARAGEKGAGFAVVAAEVRDMAQISARAAKSIRQLVSQSFKQAGAGAEDAKKLLGTLGEIDGHLLNLSDETARIEGALGTGGSALGQVGESLDGVIREARRQEVALVPDAPEASEPVGMRYRHR